MKKLFRSKKSKGVAGQNESKSHHERPSTLALPERSETGQSTLLNPAQTGLSHPITRGSISTSVVRRSSLLRSPSANPHSSSLGLHVIYQPDDPPPLEIVFVHGLGGDSRKTWSKNHDPSLFWPGLWLPYDPDIRKTRILSFGYNSNYRPGAPKSISNITDFAKELLFDMKFSRDQHDAPLGIGKVPIIFIVHSMGGLVVKKACILGRDDEEYKDIIQAISSIIFLSTPHRGSDLAELLSKVLAVSFQSPKNFVADLKKDSPAIQDINEQFRHLAPSMSIVSFYETLATKIGPKEILILDRYSSTLGYPKEISRPLDADHHDVCKYTSPNDSNYVNVRNMLKSMISLFRCKETGVITNQQQADTKVLQGLLGSPPSPESDFSMFRERWVPGTCNWILEELAIQSWLDGSDGSRVVWLNAAPGVGKSVLSTHIIDFLKEVRLPVQSFFYRFGDPTKQSHSAFLRSMAIQAAKQIPTYHQYLLDLAAKQMRLENASSTILWQKLFEEGLLQLELAHPIFWVVDALDESESPKSLIDLLKNLGDSKLSLRILIISRKLDSISLSFQRLSGKVSIDIIEKSATVYNLADIELLVDQEIKLMRGSDLLKQRTKQTIIERSQNNFLWTRLILEEIQSCHTEEAIEETLNDVPEDMTAMYERIESNILRTQRRSSQAFAKMLLRNVLCAQRPLSIKELSESLKPDVSGILDLERTITDVCGQIVIVDRHERVMMVHQTARDFFAKTSQSELGVDVAVGNSALLSRCLTTLTEIELRSRLGQAQHALQSTEPFVFYAAIAWPYHLRRVISSSDEVVQKLQQFFTSHAVLAWIHALTFLDRLDILVEASRALTEFIHAAEKATTIRNPLLHNLFSLDVFERWSVDLVKLVGRFRKHLLRRPSAIYNLVPSVCPSGSIIHQQFYKRNESDVAISGAIYTEWNDSLGIIILPNDDQAWEILCAGSLLAVLSSSGAVYLWDSERFAEMCIIVHGEPVTALAFGTKGQQLLTYGFRTTKLWSIPSGQLIASTTNPSDTRAKTIEFTPDDRRVVAGFNDNVIRDLFVETFTDGWQVVHKDLLRFKEGSHLQGVILNSPSCISFNKDCTLVGVTYRTYPLCVWSLQDWKCVARLKRGKGQDLQDGSRPAAGWFGVERLAWNPSTGHLLGRYRDGTVFKWHPFTDDYLEARSNMVDELAMSPDGKLFLTSDNQGTVRIWSFAGFSVIYQLSSDDLVTGLVFSPDSSRFYDIRGSRINAWEPISLIRFAEPEDSLSDARSEDQSSTARTETSESWPGRYKSVSSLAVSTRRAYFCSGNEDGSVYLLHAGSGTKIEMMKFYNFLPVRHIVWAEDGQLVAAADLGGDVTIKRIDAGDSRTLDETNILLIATPKFSLHQHHQLLFGPNSDVLLVISDDQMQIFDIASCTIRASQACESASARQWISHPEGLGCFIGFGAGDACAYSWATLEKQRIYRYAHMSSDHTLSTKSKQTPSVAKLVLTHDRKYILLQTREYSLGRMLKQLLVFDTDHFSEEIGGHSSPAVATVSGVPIPTSITEQIKYPLGTLTTAAATVVLVFLDADLWLCTYRITENTSTSAMSMSSVIEIEDDIRRHYFIPRDWTTPQSLELTTLMRDGTLLCPKDAEVAIIKGRVDGLGY